MSLLFNVRRAKCIKIIFPVVKHISTNNKQQAIANLNKIKVLIRYMGPNHKNAAKSIIFGFSLIGLIDGSETNSEVIDTIERGQLYLQVSKRLNYLEYNIVFAFVYHVSVHT